MAVTLAALAAIAWVLAMTRSPDLKVILPANVPLDIVSRLDPAPSAAGQESWTHYLESQGAGAIRFEPSSSHPSALVVFYSVTLTEPALLELGSPLITWQGSRFTVIDVRRSGSPKTGIVY